MSSPNSAGVELWRQTIPHPWAGEDFLFEVEMLDEQHTPEVIQHVNYHRNALESSAADLDSVNAVRQQRQSDYLSQLDKMPTKSSNQSQARHRGHTQLELTVPAPISPPATSVDSSPNSVSTPFAKTSRVPNSSEIPSLKSVINAKLSEISQLRKLHRRAQNRNAQRAFRERKEQALRESTAQLESLKAVIDQKDTALEESQARVQLLEADVDRMQGTVRRLEQGMMRLMLERNSAYVANGKSLHDHLLIYQDKDVDNEPGDSETTVTVASP